jgi:nitrogen fixation protein NifU and related proteins
MADNNKSTPQSQPVRFFDHLDRKELEREIARRTSGRFSEKALRAALYPAHLGKMDQPDGYSNVQGYCGDLMTFYLRVVNSRVQEVMFTTNGCDATVASGETLAGLVAGRSLEEAERMTPEQLLDALEGLPPNHVHCADLAVSTLQNAVRDYRTRQGQREAT